MKNEIRITKRTLYITVIVLLSTISLMFLWRSQAVELRDENNLLKATLNAKFDKCGKLSNVNVTNEEIGVQLDKMNDHN